MRKLILVIGALFMGACSSVQRPSAVPVVGPRASLFMQEALVELINNCAPFLYVMDGDKVRLVLRGSGSHYVRAQRGMGRGDYGTNVHITLKAYAFEDEAGYLGSVSGSWYVDNHTSGARTPWAVDHLTSIPKGSPGCTGFRTGHFDEMRQWFGELF